MNKFIKISIITLIVILIIGIGIYYYIFKMGSYAYEDVMIDKVTVSNNSVKIEGYLSGSGSAYKDYKYQLVGTELYVQIRSVLVSKKYNSPSFTIEIPINGNEINNISLSNEKKTKLIYSKN